MKYRMLLVLILICAIVVAAAGVTFSYYANSIALSYSIEPDISEPTPTLTSTPTPTPSYISVLYQTSEAWVHQGEYRFNYSITITNNSSQTIQAWYISFMLSQDVLISVNNNAVMTQGLPSGTYEFVNPGKKNRTNISPGANVTFSGQGSGYGQAAPQNVQVGGSNIPLTGVDLTCDLGGL